MSDFDYLVEVANVFYPLREPTILAAIQAFQPQTGSRGLDAGCGIGLQATLLARAVGPAGHVTGLDLSREALVYAKNMVERSGLSDRVTFKAGDVADSGGIYAGRYAVGEFIGAGGECAVWRNGR